MSPGSPVGPVDPVIPVEPVNPLSPVGPCMPSKLTVKETTFVKSPVTSSISLKTTVPVSTS